MRTLVTCVLVAVLSSQPPLSRRVEFIDTGFENASPVWYDEDADGTIRIHLLYDHERNSPNRAAGHIHFGVLARPGATLTFEFKNLDNVWNGKPGSVARELKAVVISEDGRAWTPVPLESLPGDRVRLTVTMPGPRLFVARVEPYRLSDLDHFLARIRAHRLVDISTIGKTVEGRDLEIVRVGNPNAPYRVFLRARAHPWEPAGNWIVQGLIDRLLRSDEQAKTFLDRYCVYVMPMANKDGVARGRTRFNLRGMDLNRNWDKPADAELSPENHALERWLDAEIASGRRPHLAIELHNDGSGRLHISRPPGPNLQRHLDRMTALERLLRKHTWFTEGSTGQDFRNAGTLGDGWLQRFGIDAVVHEFNCNWIAGVKAHPTGRHWEDYGKALATVFAEYFGLVKPSSGAEAAPVVETVDAALREHQHDLTTKGRTFLEQEAAAASFFMIGELHGDNEIPALVRAIWPALWKAGYRHIAAELSPWTAHRLEFDPNAPARAFSWSRSDVGFVAARREGTNAVLWGCDMEEVRPHLLLQELAAANPTNRELQSAAELTRGGYQRPAAPKLLEHVRNAGAIKDPIVAGVSLRSVIVRTLEIEVDRLSPETRLSASHRREMLSKELFHQYWQTNGNPKVMLRLGRNHLHRGYDRRGVSTLGNFVAELAAQRGLKAFNVAAVAVGGKINYGGRVMDFDERPGDPAFAYLASRASHATTVFDLRPLRQPLHRIPESKRSPAESSLVYWADSYDAILLYREVTPIP